MERSVVFVHGTGVRAKSYVSTFERIRHELCDLRPGIEVRGCFWGDSEGARFVRGGASVPGYTDSGGGRSEKDEDVAQWGLLYADPGYELRLLSLRPRPSGGAHRGVPPSRRLLSALREYKPSVESVALFARYGLADDLDAALREVLDSPELRDAAATVDQNGYEHRRAVARALVATVLSRAQDRGEDAVDGTARAALVAVLGADLHTTARGLPGAVGKAAAATALRIFTKSAERRRGSLSDGLLPMTGDILRYQARGEGIRRLIARTIADTPGSQVTVIAHSLGGVACVDLLALEALDRVTTLITVGSQASYFYECGALVSAEHPETLPDRFPRRWLNIYDPWDLLAYQVRNVFGDDRAHDVRVDNGQPFPYTHSAYWCNAQVWDAVDAWLD
ncbi:hypothetical protein R6V09_16190 [Streptomyces sp. W16]|uniref:hypothetical protein n=1 Tax=Streptomyces sp. W16 TaxID=3076631 RepID=UPI00295BDD8D|nr:hypothetical protein [Streptomyces sp. W16]MDV9171654.1 hypothetical protein [Streptomyces sp. W16]